MKKTVILIVVTLFILILSTILVVISKSSTIKDEALINEIKENSHLDLLVNIKDYSKEKYNESELLDISMQIAEKIGLLNENTENNTYVQYVTKDDLHQIIFELTGITIEAPIEIEDFYYLYDSENEYYYYRPASPSYYSIDSIKQVKKNGSVYNITCSVSKNIDLEKTTIENVNVEITHVPENKFIQYKLETISYN